MFLNDTDLKKFDEDGYLFFPEMFSKDEASLLNCLLYTSDAADEP